MQSISTSSGFNNVNAQNQTQLREINIEPLSPVRAMTTPLTLAMEMNRWI